MILPLICCQITVLTIKRFAGQLGKTDLMIEMFLDEAEAHLKTLLLFKISS
jgi:hypothetical protein